MTLFTQLSNFVTFPQIICTATTYFITVRNVHNSLKGFTMILKSKDSKIWIDWTKKNLVFRNYFIC
jgi:hypothetical protein